jgi:hypothetical protein
MMKAWENTSTSDFSLSIMHIIQVQVADSLAEAKMINSLRFR